MRKLLHFSDVNLERCLYSCLLSVSGLVFPYSDAIQSLLIVKSELPFFTGCPTFLSSEVDHVNIFPFRKFRQVSETSKLIGLSSVVIRLFGTDFKDGSCAQ